MKLDGLTHPKTKRPPGREFHYGKFPNEDLMDLDALPMLPPELREKRPNYFEWKKIKASIHMRSGCICHYCGTDASTYPVCDHLIPICRGGNNDESNLVTSCDDCNSRKGNLTPDEFSVKRGDL